MEEIRINKYLSEAGFCSRRQADKYVEAGKVFIDGKKAVVGSKVADGQRVVCNGKEVKKEDEFILIAFNKPKGIVCTSEKREKDNIIDYINYDKRIYPIGRLDKQSEGLILLTNNGEIVNGILKASNKHEKEYIVSVDKIITKEFIENMSKGVYLEELDRTTRPCKVEKIGECRFRIILTQGLNRQIRRMTKCFGYRVTKLKRVRIMNIRLEDLKVGTYRNVSGQELKDLLNLIK